jgi:ABC-2 type transport system permease protein
MNNSNWLIRREFWENRAIWMIPAVFGALLLLAALFGQVSIPRLSSQNESDQAAAAFLVVVGAMFYLVMGVYSTWYLLDCLYTDRKDRSILFWKSLPISDATTVLCKLLVGMIIIPLVYFAAADATALIAAFILSIRAVMLWAVLPPLLLYILERVFFGTHMVGHIIMRRLTALPSVSFNGSKYNWTHDGGVVDNAGSVTPSVWHLINPSGFFSNAETWIGVAVGIALIVTAIQLRMRRSEI